MSDERNVEILRKSDLDFLICVHYPFIMRSPILSIPRTGVLNIHPAYLPFNRGWNTPTWAILEGTPYGATIHFMNETLDMGDIIGRKELNIEPDDTADSLYKKVFGVELTLFKEIWPKLVSQQYDRIVQQPDTGTMHKKRDLVSIRCLQMDKPTTAREVITQLRALTTNNHDESAYFEEQGKKYRIVISIQREIE
jgi:methionyl-tRNA formyltransferase